MSPRLKDIELCDLRRIAQVEAPHTQEIRVPKNGYRGRRAAAVAASVLMMVSCGNESHPGSSPDEVLASEPETSADGREVDHFDSIPAMAAGSDLVMRAKVAEVGVGEAYGESEADQFTTRHVTLKPLEVVKGAFTGESVTYEEHGWYADGSGYVMNGVLWSKPGDQAWYFLHKREDTGTYRLVVSYGRYAVDAGLRGPSGHHPKVEGPWASLPGSVLDDPAAVAKVIRSTSTEGQRR